MGKEFIETVLKRIPYFDEKNCQELKVKVCSWSCCMTKNEKGKWIRHEAILHFIHDENEKIIGYLGQCPNCKKNYYYECT